MTSPEKRRQIQHWALSVAACANGIDELRVNDAPETSGTERSGTTATSYGTSLPPRTLKPRKDPHLVRVIVQPSSSDGSTKSRDRSRGVRSARPAIVNDTSGYPSRSRPAYTSSQESYMRRANSPPRLLRNRPSTPPGTYSRVRRIPRPEPSEPETNIRYYADDRPWYYKEEQLRPPSMPSKPSRPRPRSVDARRVYHPRPPSPPTQRAPVGNPPPQRTTYVRKYETPPRRTVSVRDRGDARMMGRWDDRPNSARQLNQLYDDVDRLRSLDTRRVYTMDDLGRRGRSIEYSGYDDYDDDYYDNRRRVG